MSVLPLYICPACNSERVYVREWLQAQDDQVAIDRRCPDCEWTHADIASGAALEELDDALARADASMVTWLHQSAAMDVQEWNAHIGAALADTTD